MTDFATLVLAADTRQMTQAERAIDGVTKAGGRAETQTNKTSNAISNMDKMARRAALGAVALVGSIVALTRSSANQIDALSKQAAQVGILTRNFQAMSLVANEAGVSTETLTSQIAFMQRNLVELGRGTALQTRAFQQLGLTIRDLQGLSPDQQFERIATALAGVQDPAQRTALAMEVFGRSGRAAINMLEGYTEALEDARRFQEGFGLAVGQTSAQAIERANDAMDRLMSGFRGLGNLLAVELAPRMERFANSMIETIIQSNAIQRTANVLIGLFDRIGFYAGAAAIAFGAYKVATIAATVATVGLSGALVVARAALLRLGLGVIIVAAGELAFRISKLIESTGGWGNALSLLGEVASGVWTGITTSASAIVPGLNSVFEKVKASFFSLLEELTRKWMEFLSTLSVNIASIPGAGGIAEGLGNAAANAFESMSRFEAQVNSANRASETLATTARNQLTTGFATARDALSRLNTTVEQNTESTEDGTDAANALNVALDNVSDGAGGAGAAVKGLNDELQQTPQWVTGVSDAFADLVMRGFKDFRSFAQSVVNTFRNMLRDMIAMAARNRIMISLGMGGAGGPAMAGSGLPGIGGMMSSAVGSFGGGAGMAGFADGTGFLGGVGNVIGGLSSGGLAGGGAAISSAIGGMAGGGVTGLAAAAGAVALPLLAVAAVASLFSSKTKELDRGLNITVQNMDTLVQSFRKVETSRFWGLSKRISTTIDSVADEISDPIVNVISSMQKRAMDAAKKIGVSADIFSDFARDLNISLVGLSNEQAMQKVSKEIMDLGDNFAAMVGNFQSLRDLEGFSMRFRTVDLDRIPGVHPNNFAPPTVEEAIANIGYHAAMRIGVPESMRLNLSYLDENEEFRNALEQAIAAMTTVDRINATFYETFRLSDQVTPTTGLARIQMELRRQLDQFMGFVNEVFQMPNDFADQIDLLGSEFIKIQDRFAEFDIPSLLPGEKMRRATGREFAEADFALNNELLMIRQRLLTRMAFFGSEVAGDMLRELDNAIYVYELTIRTQLGRVAQQINTFLISGLAEIVTPLGEANFEKAKSSLDSALELVNALSLVAAELDNRFGVESNFAPIARVIRRAQEEVDRAAIAPMSGALPVGLQSEAGSMFASIVSLASGIGTGNIQAYSDAVVRISQMFAEGEVNVTAYETAFELFNRALDGTVERVQNAEVALGRMGDNVRRALLSIVSTLDQGLRRLSQTSETFSASADRSAMAFLRNVQASGLLPDATNDFARAVETASGISSNLFATQVDFLREVAQRSGLLSDIRTRTGAVLSDVDRILLVENAQLDELKTTNVLLSDFLSLRDSLERDRESLIATPDRISMQVDESEKLRQEVSEMKDYIRELVKINHRQERTLKEIEFQGETA